MTNNLLEKLSNQTYVRLCEPLWELVASDVLSVFSTGLGVDSEADPATVDSVSLLVYGSLTAHCCARSHVLNAALT